MKLNKGLLVVFEGIDGSGKTTQARSLLRRLRARGYQATYFREPSRGQWGRLIKILAKEKDSLTPEEQLAFFVLDRQENVQKNLQPALKKREIVILDRYYFSTIAYQGAKGLDPVMIKRLNERFAPRPDLVFFLDVKVRTGLGRISDRKTRDSLFEQDRYLARVASIFQTFQGRKFIHLDGSADRRLIGKKIWEYVSKLLDRYRR